MEKRKSGNFFEERLVNYYYCDVTTRWKQRFVVANNNNNMRRLGLLDASPVYSIVSSVRQERGRACCPVVRALARAVHHRGLHRRGLPLAVRWTGLRPGGGHQEDGGRARGLWELHRRAAEPRRGRSVAVGDQEHRASHGPRVPCRVRGMRRRRRLGCSVTAQGSSAT